MRHRIVAGSVVYGLLHAAALCVAVAGPGYAFVAAIGAAIAHSRTSATAIAFQPLTLRWFDSLWNSCGLVVIACLVALGGATFLGWVLARCRAGALETLFIAIVCVPYAALEAFIFAPIHFWLLYGSVVACGIVHGVIFLPLATLGLGRAFAGVDRDLTDAARLDAGEWRTVRRVLIPAAAWAYVAIGVYLAIFVLTDYTISDVFRVRTFAEEIFLQYALDTSLGRAALTGFPVLFLVALLLLGASRKLRDYGTWDAGATASEEERAIGRRARRPVLVWVVTLATLATVVTLVSIVARRLDSAADFAARAESMAPELRNSAIVALATVALLLGAGVGLSWAMLRARRLRWAAIAASVLILGTPAPVIAIALIHILDRPGVLGTIYDTPGGMILGLFSRFLPFAMLLLAPAVQRIPRALEESMLIDGASWATVQRRLVWPCVARDLVFCALVLLVAAFGEIAVTLLLAPPGYPTVSVRAYTLLHFGVYQDVAALALTSTALVLALVFTVRFAVRRFIRRALPS